MRVGRLSRPTAPAERHLGEPRTQSIEGPPPGLTRGDGVDKEHAGREVRGAADRGLNVGP